MLGFNTNEAEVASKVYPSDGYAIRDPLYREIADYVIETGKPSVNQLVNTLIMQLELSA